MPTVGGCVLEGSSAAAQPTAVEMGYGEWEQDDDGAKDKEAAFEEEMETLVEEAPAESRTRSVLREAQELIAEGEEAREMEHLELQ